VLRKPQQAPRKLQQLRIPFVGSERQHTATLLEKHGRNHSLFWAQSEVDRCVASYSGAEGRFLFSGYGTAVTRLATRGGMGCSGAPPTPSCCRHPRPWRCSCDQQGSRPERDTVCRSSPSDVAPAAYAPVERTGSVVRGVGPFRRTERRRRRRLRLPTIASGRSTWSTSATSDVRRLRTQNSGFIASASASARARLRCARKWASSPECAVSRSRLEPVRNIWPPTRLDMQAPRAKKTR
jgi:hypothetical protein